MGDAEYYKHVSFVCCIHTFRSDALMSNKFNPPICKTLEKNTVNNCHKYKAALIIISASKKGIRSIYTVLVEQCSQRHTI